MRSFAIIVAALFFGALSWAAPVPEDNGLALRGLEVAPVQARDVLATLPEKRGSPDSLEFILTGLLSDLTPHTEKLSACTKDEATVEGLTEVVGEIVELILAAVEDVLKLVGCTVEEILGKSEGGLLDCGALAKLIADIIILVLKAVGLILTLLDSILDGDLFNLLCTILSALAKLIQCILDLVVDLVVGLLAAIIALVGEILWVVLFFGVADLVKLLCAIL